VNINNAFIFNSVLSLNDNKSNLWQHFYGIEIETNEDFFNDNTAVLMDFDCEQRNSVHFFYTLPFTKKRALIETTWISKEDGSLKDYESQVKNYINYLGIKDYKINFKEEGAIPLFYPTNKKEKNKINIGTVGGMTRLSTGYTFLNIQEHCKYIRENIENINNIKLFQISKKYDFLDKIFLKVLKNNSSQMGDIFYKMFNSSPSAVINFLSNKSSLFEDLEIISKMPKWMFIRQIF
jgi:lycopene beta-cyclase